MLNPLKQHQENPFEGISVERLIELISSRHIHSGGYTLSGMLRHSVVPKSGIPYLLFFPSLDILNIILSLDIFLKLELVSILPKRAK